MSNEIGVPESLWQFVHQVVDRLPPHRRPARLLQRRPARVLGVDGRRAGSRVRGSANSLDVFSGAGIDPNALALLEKQRHQYDGSGFDGGGLGSTLRGVSLHPGVAFDDRRFDEGRKIDVDRLCHSRRARRRRDFPSGIYARRRPVLARRESGRRSRVSMKISDSASA